MMKMRIAAVLAAVMIGSAAMPAVTAFAYGNDPAQTTAAETTPVETESVKETSADAVTAETEKKDSAEAETETVADSEETADNEASETGEIDLSGLDLSQIPGIDASLFTDILSDMDPEVVEVLLKNPKLLAYFLPTLHVTVTDTSVTVAVDGDERVGAAGGDVPAAGRPERGDILPVKTHNSQQQSLHSTAPSS